MIVLGRDYLALTIALVLLALPVLVLVYTNKSYYYIDNGLIIKKSVIKSKPLDSADLGPSFTISIRLIDYIDIKKQRGSNRDIKFWSINDRIPLGHIQIEHGDRLIRELLSINQDIQVLEKT